MVVNIVALTGKLSFIVNPLAPVRLASAVSTRSYSIFPSYFIKPTFRKEEQEILKETGEATKIATLSIIPAFTSETSSEFYDPLVRKFTNFIMRKGKKELARNLLEGTFVNIKRIQLRKYHQSKGDEIEEVELDPVKILHRAVENVMPVMQLMKMKRGGVTYQVPVPILEGRQSFMAITWLIEAGKEKHRKIHLPESLATVLIDAAYNRGSVVKKKQDLHKQCEANRAYAHYRWS